MTELKPFYTLSEMMSLFKKKRNSTSHTMDLLGVPKNKIGKLTVYYLNDIQTFAPKLYESLKSVILDSDEVEILDECS